MIRKYSEIFCWKNVSSFCSAKVTHIFSAKNIRILYIESAKTVNEMTLNEIVKLTTLWTTGPRMTIAKEHLGCFNHDENMFLNCIVTGNEMWVRYAEPETKAQQKQWKQAGSILANFMPKGRTVTARYYSEAILKKKKIKENLKKLHPRLAQKNVLLLHDNTPSHTASSTEELTNSFKWQLFSNSPYSPDVAPATFVCFQNWKKGAL